MSGYLEVKYPFKSNLGLNPFKSWKRQWCILRPSPTSSGGSLAVYCSEAGAAAGTVALPSGCVVRRAKSRSRPFAFAVFRSEEPRKPQVLLAAPSLHEAHAWMDKIKAVLDGDKLLGTESLLKESFTVTVIATALSEKCSVDDSTVVTVSSEGLRLSPSMLVEWKHISDILVSPDSTDNRLCVVCVDSGFLGGGALRLRCEAGGGGLASALRARAAHTRTRSLADLLEIGRQTHENRGSWYSGPSETSLDDLELGNAKWSPPGDPRARLHSAPADCGHGRSDRRSLTSIASGIYEEIPDLPDTDVTDSPVIGPDDSAPEPDNAVNEPDGSVLNLDDSGSACDDSGPDDSDGQEIPDDSCEEGVYCPMARLAPPHISEPMYESVAECVYGTSCTKPVTAWPGVTRHGSLGALTRTHTLPHPQKKQPFSVFRKRLKSDSRIATSPKSDTKENKDIETKKKRFEFTPTRDIFKSFMVGRKMKNLKITNTLDAPLETKSCEFLDEPEHLEANRSSKSVEYLDEEFYDEDLELRLSESSAAALALPQEIVAWLLLRRPPPAPAPPLMPPPVPPHEHYIAMAPKAPRA